MRKHSSYSNPSYLRPDVLVVDKTGTPTEGKPKITAVRPAPDFTRDELLRLAASLEQASSPRHRLPSKS